MAVATKPIILNETGMEMVEKLQLIADALGGAEGSGVIVVSEEDFKQHEAEYRASGKTYLVSTPGDTFDANDVLYDKNTPSSGTVKSQITQLNSSLNSTTNVTSTTHTVSGKFSQIGKSVILSMSIVATSESNVFLNTPKPIKQCVALARSINTGNTVRIFMSSTYNTAYFLDTPVVGNTYDFNVSYITN